MGVTGRATRSCTTTWAATSAERPGAQSAREHALQQAILSHRTRARKQAEGVIGSLVQVQLRSAILCGSFAQAFHRVLERGDDLGQLRGCRSQAPALQAAFMPRTEQSS